MFCQFCKRQINTDNLKEIQLQAHEGCKNEIENFRPDPYINLLDWLNIQRMF